MIGSLIACNHAEACNPRLLGSVGNSAATIPGRHGPPSSASRDPSGLLAEPGAPAAGKCAHARSPDAQADPLCSGAHQ